MRATIVAADNIVVVDGVARTVDTSAVAAEGKHAVQWNDTFGEVEFVTTIDEETKMMSRLPNEVITDFAPYQPYIDAWTVENAKQSLIEEAQRRKQEEMLAQAKEHEARQAALREAFEKLPQAERRKIAEEQQRRQIIAEEQADKVRVEAWNKLPQDERERLLAVVRDTL